MSGSVIRCLVFFSAVVCCAETHFVSPTGNSHSPFTNWVDAATNIQDAIDVATEGSSVVVTDGVYILVGTLQITNGIVFTSVNGALYTHIQGSNSIGCLFLSSSNAVVRGFTLSDGIKYGEIGGGGVCISNAGTVEWCIVKNNAAQYGAGVYLYKGGVIRNCLIQSNWVNGGLGAGIHCDNGGVVEGCLVCANYSSSGGSGGGIYCRNGGLVRNCTIAGNWVTDYNFNFGQGGGICCKDTATVVNTVIVSNHANYGVGDNWFNTGTGVTYSFCVSVPELAGDSNSTNDPHFVDFSSQDFHLKADSPCVDAGTNCDWMATAKDIDGQVRIFNQQVDIGADEAVIEASCIGNSGAVTTLWNTVVGATCSLECASSLAPPDWTNCSETVVVTNSITAFAITNASKAYSCFRLNWWR